jgi:ADP-heptose:LPS heptosyltransferase
MDWKQRAIALGTDLALAGERVLRAPRRAADRGAPERVLVLHFPPTLGATVHQTPLFEALKQTGTVRRIVVATEGVALDVLRHSPFVDDLLEVPNPSRGMIPAVRSLRLQLRERALQPDCLLTGVFDRRRAVVRLGALAARGWRGGFTEDPRLCHRPLVFDDAKSVIENNLRVAGLIGWDGQGLEPRVGFSEADLAYAGELLASAGGRPRLVVISQGSGGPAAGWHEERFAEVIRHAVDELGCAVFYDGLEKDASGIESLRAKAGGRGLSLAGRTRVDQLAAVLALSDLAIAVDTGTMHVGRAAGVPMVVLAPSWQPAHSWLPIGLPQVRVLQGPYRRDHGETYQLDEISVPAVNAAVRELIGLYPASDAGRMRRVAKGLSRVDLLGGRLES